MYYYIIYNSSIIDKGDDGKKYLTTLLYGSISYILTHAYLSSSSSKVVQSIKDYFWLVLLLDIGAMAYVYTNEDGVVDWQDNINKLKNDISKYTNDNQTTQDNSQLSSTNNNLHNIPTMDTDNYETHSDTDSVDNSVDNSSSIHALNNMIDDVMKEQPFDDQYNVSIHKPDELKENFNTLNNERDKLTDSFSNINNNNTNTNNLPPIGAMHYDPKIDIKSVNTKDKKSKNTNQKNNKSTPISQLMSNSNNIKNKNPSRTMTQELEEMIANDSASDSGSEIDLNFDEFESAIDL